MGNKYVRRAVEAGMNTILNNRDLLALIQAGEKARRREAFEQGRLAGQHTARSINKGRVTKRPGKGSRADQNRRAIGEF